MQFTMFITAAMATILSALASAAPVASPDLGPTVIPTVKVQLNWNFNQKSQADVPLNNAAFTTQGHFATTVADSAFLESAPAGISLTVIQCQGYTDAAGTVKVGNAFRGDDIALFGVGGEIKPVGSLRCGFVFT